MIESPQNEKLKQIRKLQSKKYREKLGMFAAEGEDLVLAALAAGWIPRELLATEEAPRAIRSHPVAEAVTSDALGSASALGSGTRAIGVFEQRWSPAGGDLSVYLDAVADPGNVGTVLRSALAFADGAVVLGPGCADPYSPKAVRASMGAVFTRPPARAQVDELVGTTVALDAAAAYELRDLTVEPPVVVCVGAERDGLSLGVVEGTDLSAHLAMRPDGPESVNAGVAASIALYALNNRYLNRSSESQAEENSE